MSERSTIMAPPKKCQALFVREKVPGTSVWLGLVLVALMGRVEAGSRGLQVFQLDLRSPVLHQIPTGVQHLNADHRPVRAEVDRHIFRQAGRRHLKFARLQADVRGIYRRIVSDLHGLGLLEVKGVDGDDDGLSRFVFGHGHHLLDVVEPFTPRPVELEVLPVSDPPMLGGGPLTVTDRVEHFIFRRTALQHLLARMA